MANCTQFRHKGLCSLLKQRSEKEAEEKCNFIATHAQGSQDNTPTSVLPYIMN
jgi:hypothetical protein